MKKRITFNLLVGLVLLIIYYALRFFLNDQIIHPRTDVIILSMVLITILSDWITQSGIRSNTTNIVSYLLGAMIARLIFGIILITILLLITTENRLSLSVNFLVVYLLFVVFDINASIANLRQFFRKGRDED